MFRNHWSALLALVLLALLGHSARAGEPCGEGSWYPLIAGQHLDVGRVTVWNAEDTLHVRIETGDGWLLEETAVHVGTSLDDIPVNRTGAPVPGRFDYRREHDGDIETEYEIPWAWPPDSELVIAVHASVRRPGGGGSGDRQETAWGGYDPGPGPRWWFVIRYVPDPCDDPEPPDDDDDGDDDGGGDPPTDEGGTGCTPGYWENHPQVWSVTGFDPDDRVSTVFRSTRGAPEGRRSLIRSLNIEGDDTFWGAIRILLRHAVAAVLNGAHPDVDYALSVREIVRLVNEAIESESRERILALKDRLDRYNNSGCRLGNSPRVGGAGDDGNREGSEGEPEPDRDASAWAEAGKRDADKARKREQRDAEKARERAEREARKAAEREAEKAREREKSKKGGGNR